MDILEKRKKFLEMYPNGTRKSKLYNVWKMMKYRCSENGDKKHRKNYYDRGIRVCDEWQKFENFYQWAINNGYREDDLYDSGRNKITIDRIDNNGNYEPNNCRFITFRENQWNKRTSLHANYKGKNKNLFEISKETKMGIDCLRTRVYRGKNMDDPYVEKKNEKYLYNGEYLTKRELSDKYNISLHAIIGRLNRGWSIEETMETPLLNYKKNIQLYKYNNKYYCIAELARILGLKRTTLQYRIKHGIMNFEIKKEVI